MTLVRGRKESKLVRSLVLYVKLGVRFLAALRLALRIGTYRGRSVCYVLYKIIAACTLN